MEKISMDLGKGVSRTVKPEIFRGRLMCEYLEVNRYCFLNCPHFEVFRDCALRI